MIRRHPKDSIFACLLLQGEAFFYQSGSCIRVNEGDLIVYGTTMPYLHGFTRDMRQLLDESLASPELNAALVAQHVCVSVRQLDRIFARHGCTATQWIWQQRLERARCFLSDPGRLGLTVGEIALQCGFATQAHFGGAFRARYGTTPMEHRVGSALRR